MVGSARCVPLTCRLRPREEKAGMQQARIGHQNGALLFLSSSGHSQPGWFSSPAARGRRWEELVRERGPSGLPESPGSHRGPQRPGPHAPRTQPAAPPAPRLPGEMKSSLTPRSQPWVPGWESGNLRLQSQLAHPLTEQACANLPDTLSLDFFTYEIGTMKMPSSCSCCEDPVK